MVVLDTNVVAELMKLTPAPAVIDWINATPGARIFMSAVTQAEIPYGVSILPPGKRRDGLMHAARTAFAEIAADRRRSSRPKECGVEIINPCNSTSK